MGGLLYFGACLSTHADPSSEVCLSEVPPQRCYLSCKELVHLYKEVFYSYHQVAEMISRLESFLFFSQTIGVELLSMLAQIASKKLVLSIRVLF